MEYYFSDQLAATFDREQRAMWLRWKPAPRPCFNPALLRDLDRYCRMLTDTGGAVAPLGAVAEYVPLEYAVVASAVPGIFNLGGDLSLFTDLIEKQDRGGLIRYGEACINVLYRNYICHELPITTVSLIQGDCLGGGFEAALSSQVLIAESQARFGFPEILFNLFPGMGAYSFLDRRIGSRAAKALTDGRLYSAAEMHERGVVDRVVDKGQGEAAVAELIQERKKNRNGLVGASAAQRCVNVLGYAELLSVVETWVETALQLSDRDIRLMQRLAHRQKG
jgi:DSF synthase